VPLTSASVAMASLTSASPQTLPQWMQKVHTVQSTRTPEAWQAAQLRIEQSRQHEVCYRKCKAVKSHAVRSRALAAEGLRQMAASDRPEEYMAVQERWSSAQQVSKNRQATVMKRADDALHRRSRAESPDEAMLSDAEDEEDAAMAEVAQLVGAADVVSMAAVGQEGLQPPPPGGGCSSGVSKSRNCCSSCALSQPTKQSAQPSSSCMNTMAQSSRICATVLTSSIRKAEQRCLQ